MTNETTETIQSAQKSIAIGARLKSAREALGIERKDAAAQLRLNENVITMLEKDSYPNDLPTIFVRGYIRSYGKFLQVPDYEIKEALEPIKPPVKVIAEQQPIAKPPHTSPNKHRLMRAANIAVVLTVLCLVWLWWHNHNSNANIKINEKSFALPLEEAPLQPALKAASTPLVLAPINTGNMQTTQDIKVPLAPATHQATQTTKNSPKAQADVPAYLAGSTE